MTGTSCVGERRPQSDCLKGLGVEPNLPIKQGWFTPSSLSRGARGVRGVGVQVLTWIPSDVVALEGSLLCRSFVLKPTLERCLPQAAGCGILLCLLRCSYFLLAGLVHLACIAWSHLDVQPRVARKVYLAHTDHSVIGKATVVARSAEVSSGCAVSSEQRQAARTRGSAPHSRLLHRMHRMWWPVR